MSKPPAYQHYAKDWLVGTAHLSLEQQGAYLRLLDHQWEDGPLPASPAALARLLGVSLTRFRRVWDDLKRHFPADEAGRLANPRLETERTKQETFRAGQSRRGRDGAAKRWDSQRHDVAISRAKKTPMAQAQPEHSSSSSSSSSGGEPPLPPLGAHAPPGPERLSAILGRLPEATRG